MTRLFNIMMWIAAVMFVVVMLSILLSCSHYQYYVTETKMTIKGDKIDMVEQGDPVPMKDTTINALMITKRRVR